MLPQDLEKTAVLVLLEGLLPIGHLCRSLTEHEASAAFGVDPYVKLGDVDMVDDFRVQFYSV